MPGIGVQLPPESAFSFNRNPCSAWAGTRTERRLGRHAHSRGGLDQRRQGELRSL